MKVEQAIFTSAQTSRMQGYQLVSRSPGINNVLGQELLRWGPSQSSLISTDMNDWSLNFFPVAGKQLAVSRTLYGGPEYSGRGGMQIVTLILVVEQDQLFGYQYNPLNFAHTARLLGHLRLPKSFDEPLLPIDLPEKSLYATQYRALSTEDSVEYSTELRQSVIASLEQQRRVAIVGASDPLAVLDRLLHHLAPLQRARLSFTTGLKPSVQRRFHLHFLPHVDMKLQTELASQGIARIDVAPVIADTTMSN